MTRIERIYTKENFERVRDKMAHIDEMAEKEIEKATENDLLQVEVDLDRPKQITNIEITSPRKYLKSCV